MKWTLPYRLAQSASVLLWLVLICGCSRPDTPWAYRVTAHHVKLELHLESGSFLALDTMAIEYRHGITEFYFFLNKNIVVKKVSVGHQELFCSEIDSLAQTPFAGYLMQLPRETVCYEVRLPPNFNPSMIDVLYYGDIADSLRQSMIFKSLSAPTLAANEDAKKFLDNENWYPTLPESEYDFQVTILTPGANRGIL